MVHLVPEGISESYGLRLPSHSQEEYLTPVCLVWELLSKMLQEHLNGGLKLSLREVLKNCFFRNNS